MPIKLIEPVPGKTPYYRGRGKHLGRYVDRSTKARSRALAVKVIRSWERDIESGLFSEPGEPDFATAALNYMRAGGERIFVDPLLGHFGKAPLRTIDQAAIDAAALTLLPTGTPATRNRQVYSPISAILKHAGVKFSIRRPKGSRGQELTGWLWPEQAGRLFQAADVIDREFGLLCRFLCYTGCRLSEGTVRLRTDNLRLSEGFAYIPTTKNGEPRPVHLPPHLVAALANHPRGLDRPGQMVFRWHKSGRLYKLLRKAAKAAGVDLPAREAFHIFRHTYGSWMRRYAGADTKALVATGAWKSEQSASRYAHAVVSEEARRADMLPDCGVTAEKAPTIPQALEKKG